jgi:hypothetical protein
VLGGYLGGNGITIPVILSGWLLPRSVYVNGGYVYALWLNVTAVAIEVNAPGTVDFAVIVIGLAVITGFWIAGGVII